MVQIISGFTEAALHRLHPLLRNPGSPWRTPGSHDSGGKHVCKYSLLCTRTHARMSAPAQERSKDGGKTSRHTVGTCTRLTRRHKFIRHTHTHR